MTNTVAVEQRPVVQVVAPGGNGHGPAGEVVARPGLPLPDPAACPRLPESAMPDPALAAGAGAWVDLYTDYAAAISPMTPKSFHESAALWLGSVAIARRLKLTPAHGDVYPNLFLLWLARTTLYRKTTALRRAVKLARDVFPHLLAAQDTTPEAFLSDLAGREPPMLDALAEEDKADWQAGRNFAAQKGWVLDEMSGLMAGAGKDYNAGLIESLIRFGECDELYTRSTRGQGRVVVRDSYLSLLGASTPAALAAHMGSERLWGMGWWPRFAILTPEGRPTWQEARDVPEPRELQGGLRRLYGRLPAPSWPDTPKTLTATFGRGVHEAWGRYNRGLACDLLTDDLEPRLWGTYGRLPEHALRVALILAALDWPEGDPVPCVELPHLARAILTCEEWRASAHRALSVVTETTFDKMRVRILGQIAKAGGEGVTLRELRLAMRDKTPAEIEEALLQMVKMGEIEAYNTSGRGRPTVRYRLVTE